MLFIFDWDGTISDSTGKIVACMQAAAADLKLSPLVDDAVKEIIGLSLPRAVQQLYPDISARDHVALSEGYSKHFLAADQVPSAFYPRVQETMDVLRERGHQLAVATGKSRRGLDRVFRTLGLETYFHASRCADETESKPSPKMLNELLAELNVAASEAVMVGDTEFDMEMAQRAGVPRIGVSYGAHAVERLHRYAPELCMDCFSELLGWEETR